MIRPASTYLDRHCWIWALMLIVVAACSSAPSRIADHSPATMMPSVDWISEGEVPDLVAPYGESERYILFDIDVNRDGRVDKVVSSAQNMGWDLIIFVREGEGYREALKSTNLAEDGGRVFDRIDSIFDSPRSEVFSITNSFPKGEDVAVHYVAYKSGGWELSRTVYTVYDWRQRDGQRHRCEVEQGIAFQELMLGGGLERVQQLPEAAHRDELCERI